MASDHEKLLQELRSRSKAPPAAAEKSVPPELISFSRHLDMLLPLFMAAWRCKLVRDATVIFLGMAILLSGSFWLRPLRITAGVALLALGLRGLPGGIPFLEVKTEAGFYGAHHGLQAKRNHRMQKAFEVWLKTFVPCPWQMSGELCTILPYLINCKRCSNLSYERCWMEAEDGEPFAFDWVFPDTGFDPDAPVVVLLTGLAPSQHWTAAAGFIADAAWHLSNRAKMTVVILIARGTMDTQVNKNLFHGARVTDLRQTLECMHSCLETATGRTPKIFAAGYSMGGIILANYCGQYSQNPLLKGAIHFSGLHDAAFNMNFKYSEDTWQAYLAYNLKWSIVSAAPAVMIQQLPFGTSFSLPALHLSRATFAPIGAPRFHGRWVSRIRRRQRQQADLHTDLAKPAEKKLLPNGAMTMGSLAFVAGAVDAVCCTKYRCYTNMMTGNSIIAGQALAIACWAKFAFVASMLVNYVAGVAIFRFLNLRLGRRKFAITSPLVLLAHGTADALQLCCIDTQWHLLLLALGAGLANAFSSSGPEVVTNMLTGHWNSLANFSVDLVSGRPVDAARQTAALRSLGITLALMLGVVAAQMLLQNGISPRFWWFGAAYAVIFAWHDLGKLHSARKRGVDVERIMSGKVASIVDIDKDFVSVFNGYDDVMDYYRDLSLASDDKWRNVSIPLLAVAARDDPITHCDALRAKEFSKENQNLLFLVTDRGGHVGWPWGWFPWTRGWDFMNEAIEVFINAVNTDEP
eukprot:symbB.v1.2.000215.t1/scaffold21.1/size436794/34